MTMARPSLGQDITWGSILKVIADALTVGSPGDLFATRVHDLERLVKTLSHNVEPMARKSSNRRASLAALSKSQEQTGNGTLHLRAALSPLPHSQVPETTKSIEDSHTEHTTQSVMQGDRQESHTGRGKRRRRRSDEREQSEDTTAWLEEDSTNSANEDPSSRPRKRVALDILRRRLVSNMEGKSGLAIVGTASGFLNAREAALIKLGSVGELKTARHRSAVDSIVQYWACKIFSPSGFQRLRDFIQLVRTDHEVHTARTTAELHQSRALCEQESDTLVHVFDAYYTQATTRADAVVAKCRRHLHLAHFASSYDEFDKEVCTPGSPMRTVLERAGCRTKRGRSWSDNGIDWLVARIEGVPIERVHAHEITRRRIRNELYIGHIVSNIQNAFGKGIFPLLPDNFITTYVRTLDPIRRRSLLLTDSLPGAAAGTNPFCRMSFNRSASMFLQPSMLPIR